MTDSFHADQNGQKQGPINDQLQQSLTSFNDGSSTSLQVGPPWICDKCGQTINTVEEGMLVWWSGNKNIDSGIKILHHTPESPLGGRDGCYPPSDLVHVGDEHLRYIICWEGFVRLLALSAKGKLPVDDFNKVIMRLFVPGYEQAKPHFQDAIETGVIEQRDLEGYFSPDELQTIIDHYQ